MAQERNLAGIDYPRPPLPNIDHNTFPLPEEQYVNSPSHKTGIVLHHTVSRNVRSVFDWWIEKGTRKLTRVGTSYVIGVDGIIYQFFPDDKWAWHLGRGVSTEDEARTIGIELVSEGALVSKNNQLLSFFNAKTGKGYPHKGDFIDLKQTWRGYRYFDQYSNEQIQSTIMLVDLLCDKHDISREIMGNLWDYNPIVKDFKGIFTHAQVRPDKTDVHPLFPVEELAKWCKLEVIL